MKKSIMFSMCVLILSLTTQSIQAQNAFPEFSTSETTIYLPIRAIDGYETDPEHEAGLNVKYTLENSQLFTDSAQAHIQTLAEGFSGTTDRSTPWKTITELVAAYQQQDIEGIRALFTINSQNKIDGILADPETKQRYFDFMAAIETVTVLIGFEYKGGYFAMLEIGYRGMPQGNNVAPTPVFLVKDGEKYVMSAIGLKDENNTMDANIALFLQQGHTVEDLLTPPTPEHTLTIEKSGTGNGTVEGAGIDCGEDCIEVYQEGSVLFLKAVADENSEFEGWLVDGKMTTERLEIQDDTTAIAVFNKIR